MEQLNNLSKAELIELLQDAAKNWLAHDGLWFREVEHAYGLDAAIKLDMAAWEKFSVIEAKRIMDRHNIKPNGGIPALVKALQFRLYAYINTQEIIEITDKPRLTPARQGRSGGGRQFGQGCVFRMNTCRVQESRKRQNLPPFACKPVGLVEYTNFAKTIDPRIKTRCIACPPDPRPNGCPPDQAIRAGSSGRGTVVRAGPPDKTSGEFWCAWEFTI